MADYSYLRRSLRISRIRAAFITLRRAWYSRQCRKIQRDRFRKLGGAV
jgi:hypothetical protein